MPLPEIPILSDDPTVIAWANTLRELQFILGLTVIAVAVRTLRARPVLVAPGFRARVVALCLASAYVCLTAYDRIGEPVTFQLPLGVAFLVLSTIAVHLAVSTAPAQHEGARRLEELIRMTPEERLQQALAEVLGEGTPGDSR